MPGDGTRSFDYDADGNLISLIENGSEKVYTWNAENRLTSVAPRTPSNGDKKVEFIYDYMGRRVKKTVSTWSTDHWSLSTIHYFLYDGWNLVEEITEVGTTQTSRYFVWGQDLSQSFQGAGGIGGLIATVDGAADYLYCFDGNGNVGQVVNAADGAIAARYEYDPYGKPIKAEGAYAVENPYRFSTKYHDDETGLVYYGYRYYSAELGRWINRDPIEEEGGLSLYGFVKNDAINIFDLFGRDFIALAYRPLNTPIRTLGTLGLLMHSSIEYWECPCGVGLDDWHSRDELTRICHSNGPIESVELEPSSQWYTWELGWESLIDENGLRSYKRAWSISEVMISYISFSTSTAVNAAAFYEPNRGINNSDQVQQQWRFIEALATAYPFAEERGFPTAQQWVNNNMPINRWPMSLYEVFGNNCHTFTSYIVNSTAASAPDIPGHLVGNSVPRPTTRTFSATLPSIRRNVSPVP